MIRHEEVIWQGEPCIHSWYPGGGCYTRMRGRSFVGTIPEAEHRAYTHMARIKARRTELGFVHEVKILHGDKVLCSKLGDLSTSFAFNPWAFNPWAVNPYELARKRNEAVLQRKKEQAECARRTVNPPVVLVDEVNTLGGGRLIYDGWWTGLSDAERAELVEDTKTKWRAVNNDGIHPSPEQNGVFAYQWGKNMQETTAPAQPKTVYVQNLEGLIGSQRAEVDFATARRDEVKAQLVQREAKVVAMASLLSALERALADANRVPAKKRKAKKKVVKNKPVVKAKTI